MTSVERELSSIVQFNHITNFEHSSQPVASPDLSKRFIWTEAGGQLDAAGLKPHSSIKTVVKMHKISSCRTICGCCWALLVAPSQIYDRYVTHPEGGGRMRTEGVAFSVVRWLAEPDLPLGLCQVQLLPDSCFSMHNLSLIQSQWQKQLFAHSARPWCAQRPPMHRILGGKRKSKVKIMFYSDIKLEKQ